MAFLYTIFDNPFARKALNQVAVPDDVLDNLKYKIRPYQEEAFKRFIFFETEDFDGKPSKPYHLLYNMATGSGKTLIMAGLMLELYEKGYRNFLFFVNSSNIIEKTKDNFLNKQASKYLFAEKISIDGNDVLIKEVESFDEADDQNINIKFTTIQKLHSDLTNTKENSVTYEDFENKKIALIADEAHHLSSSTKKQGVLDIIPTWENTVDKILNQSFDNVLLEFTATLDYEAEEIAEKYQDKVIYRYDLAQFRKDKYSKEINLVRSEYEEQDRILQALVLNLYRQELATTNNINLKPVILFKAKQTIKQSEENKENFHKLIDGLSGAMIENIKNTSTILIVEKAFAFFESKGFSSNEIAKRLQENFREENCLSANNDKEAELNQIRLNTLEDENNPIRAIFAVQKLNEGWDVLNLFDIVRLYEGQNTGGNNNKIGKTTLSEAQLIGRGARYFPFTLEEGQDQYTRKFDDDIENDLKVLEELYYHTREDNRYISELKKALIASGIYEDEDDLVTKDLKIKEEFKKTEFYKTGRVVFNKKVVKNYSKVNSFTDLGVKQQNIVYKLSSGAGFVSSAFGKGEDDQAHAVITSKDVKLSEISTHIIRYALSRNTFFYFDNLSSFFPNVGSHKNFVSSDEYLGGLSITFQSSPERLEAISHFDFALAVQKLLDDIENQMKANTTEYENTDFVYKDYVHEIFKDKAIRVPKDSERAKGQEELIGDKSWYVYNTNHGTTEEKKFVELFARRFEVLEKKFEDIYLVRSERALKIYDKIGRAFEPDFLLFCKQKTGEQYTYQVFIEPKGGHLLEHDKWKEDFLKEIRDHKKIIKIDTDQYFITGVPFYNYENENNFDEELKATLNFT